MFTALIKTLFTKLLSSVATLSFLEWAFFWAAEEIVKSTKTPHDNDWLARIKKAYKTPAKLNLKRATANKRRSDRPETLRRRADAGKIT